MAVISEEYRQQNSDLHIRSPKFGSKGARNARVVQDMIHEYGAESVLDYGCGKGGLRKAMGDIVRNYDPAIPEWSADPEPADIVVCADVLEHIEPECLEDVLAHLHKLTRKAALFQIACRYALEKLPDGRNTHQIVESPVWWMDKLKERFQLDGFALDDDVVAFVARP